MPENTEAWELWQAVSTQWRAGGMGLIGLDYPAVEMVAGKLDIEFDATTMKKIAAIEREVLKEQGRKEPVKSISDYCASCAAAGRNTDCSTCDLDTGITIAEVVNE